MYTIKKCFFGLEKRLDSIWVGNFGNVREYYRAFTTLVEQMNLCVAKSDALTTREKSKYFEKGLAVWMREK